MSKEPMRGNQLGQALSRALNTTVIPKAKNPPFVAAQVDERALLDDLRTWLARLAAGERVPTLQMTPTAKMPGHRRQEIVDRLKARGFITVKTGAFGGAMATQRLIDAGREDISDAALRAIALADISEEEQASAALSPNVVEEVVVENAATSEDYAPSPLPPHGGKARDDAFVANVRNWLLRGLDGGKVRTGQMSSEGASYPDRQAPA